MLNKVERYRVVKLYRICCFLAQLPTEVDLASWTLKAPSLRKRWISYLSWIFYFLHALYKGGSLVYVFLWDPDVQLYHLVIHAQLTMSSVTLFLWYVSVYICNPALFAKYFSTTLLGNIGGLTNREDLFKKHWTRNLREYSLQDFIASSLPYIITMGILAIVSSYIYDPTMKLLLYAVLPAHLQTWTTFGLCLLEEIRFMFVMTGIASPLWQLQVISYDLINNRLEQLMLKIQRGNVSMRKIYMLLRRLQLYVSYVNSVNSYVIFTWKLLSIVACVLTGYSAVAYFQKHPIFGIMYYALFFNAAFTYTVIYEKAFQIPRHFDQAAACALLHMRGNRRHIFRRQIRSIPRAGIKVGDFHKLERASTPIFLDFVLKNLVSMLVAYA